MAKLDCNGVVLFNQPSFVGVAELLDLVFTLTGTAAVMLAFQQAQAFGFATTKIACSAVATEVLLPTSLDVGGDACVIMPIISLNNIHKPV